MRKMIARSTPRLMIIMCVLFLLAGSLSAGVFTEIIPVYKELVVHVTSEEHGYRIKEVTITGNGPLPLPNDQVQIILTLHQGDWYDERKADGDVKNITDLYGYRGYQAKVNKKLVFAGEAIAPGMVSVEYQVAVSPPKHGPIVISVSNDGTTAHTNRKTDAGVTRSYPALREGKEP